MKKTYVTTMYRWGDKECHSYVMYAGDNIDYAISVGIQEKRDRGNKYDPEVLEFDESGIINKVIYDIPKE